MDILLSDIPRLQGLYTFTFKKYDINDMDNYRLLEQMEQQYGTAGEDLPVIFMGDSSVYGPDKVHARLEGIVRSYDARYKSPPDTVTPPPDSMPSLPDTIMRPSHGDIHLYYFTQTGCQECSRTDILIKNVEAEYDHVVIHGYDLSEDSAKILYEAIARYAAIPPNERLVAPTVVMGRDFLIKENITLRGLDSLFAVYANGSPMLDTLDLESAQQSIIERFSRFSIFGIIFAGLLDGVNPCAFATLVFFVSYLLFIGKRRRDVVLMATSFVSAVFIAYLGIGVGAFNLFKVLARIDIIAQVLYIGFGVFAVILGILSLRDYVLARSGETSRMILQLPLGIKQRIHKNIREQTAAGGIVIGSFIAGFLVSFLEFGCTGQVYLPTIAFMISNKGLAVQPLFALVLYNLMFILPLIIIAFLAVMVSQNKVARYLESHIAVVKLFTALLFFGLGVVLFLSAW